MLEPTPQPPRPRVVSKDPRFLPRVGLVYPLIFLHFGSRLFEPRIAAVVASLASLVGIPVLTWLSRAHVAPRSNAVGLLAMLSALFYAAITFQLVDVDAAELPASVRIARAAAVAMVGIWGYVWIQSRRA